MIEKIKELRSITSAGMADCKKALEESGKNVQEAVKWLRENGIAKAAKKADRIAAEGSVFTASNNDKSVIIELNSETDFASKNDKFILSGNKITETILNSSFNSLEEILTLPIDGETIESFVTNLTATIGEKITLRRVEISNTTSGIYKHSNDRIAVIVEGKDIDVKILKDVAMHVAAMSPQFLSKNDISEDILKSETELAKLQLEDQIVGKPESVIEGMIQGKVNKVLAEGTLLEQDFVKNPSQKIKDLQGSGKITKFIRVEVGEGIKKKEENFAEEVAKQMQG